MQLKETKNILNQFAKYVIQQSRTNLSKGDKNSSKKLYNSLDYKISESSKGIAIQFLMDEYGVYQDKGVRGKKSYYADKATSSSPFSYKSKMPPSKAFDKWAVRKGIAPRDKSGKFIPRKTINFLIARSVFNKGIRASLFFTKPFEKAFERLPKDLIKVFINDIEKTIE
tara:strand:- start:42 stop:548 length:507 start_codon:yes stop_codon:yes gene_type:complete